MDADRIDLTGDALARGGIDRLLVDHAPDVLHGFGRVLDHRIGFLARRQEAGIRVGPVGKDFLGNAQAVLAGGFALLGIGLGEEDQVAINSPRGPCDGLGHLDAFRRHVGHHAMRFHVGNLGAMEGRDRLQGADLVGDVGLQLLDGEIDDAAAEPLEVGKARMGADRHAVLRAELHRIHHHDRVAGVEAAGHVGRGHDLQHLGVVAHHPRPEALAQVGVDIHVSGIRRCGHGRLPQSEALS